MKTVRAIGRIWPGIVLVVVAVADLISSPKAFLGARFFLYALLSVVRSDRLGNLLVYLSGGLFAIGVWSCVVPYRSWWESVCLLSVSGVLAVAFTRRWKRIKSE